MNPERFNATHTSGCFHGSDGCCRQAYPIFKSNLKEVLRNDDHQFIQRAKRLASEF